mmetsp:Transcript_28747/g.68686  ORF Transcript_28747/g.68686 Transcript_28747/m.68686 type:complete len:279 (+) Transcript_28747:4527-5363(+)
MVATSLSTCESEVRSICTERSTRIEMESRNVLRCSPSTLRRVLRSCIPMTSTRVVHSCASASCVLSACRPRVCVCWQCSRLNFCTTFTSWLAYSSTASGFFAASACRTRSALWMLARSTRPVCCSATCLRPLAISALTQPMNCEMLSLFSSGDGTSRYLLTMRHSASMTLALSQGRQVLSSWFTAEWFGASDWSMLRSSSVLMISSPVYRFAAWLSLFSITFSKYWNLSTAVGQIASALSSSFTHRSLRCAVSLGSAAISATRIRKFTTISIIVEFGW